MTQRARARNGRRGWLGRGFPPFSAYSGSQSRVYVGQRLSNCQGSTPLFFSTDNNSLAPPSPSSPPPRIDAGPADKKIMDRHGSCVTWKRNEAARSNLSGRSCEESCGSLEKVVPRESKLKLLVVELE